MQKQKVNLKSLEIIGAVFGIVFGTMLHFAYEWSGNNVFVGLFSAVNESVWEHTKLLFLPILIYMIVELYFVRNLNKVLMAKVLELLFTIFFVITFFYTYTGAFGFENLFVDIASFFVAVMLGKLISYAILSWKEESVGYTPLHIMVLVMLSLFFFVATFAPPEIPLFKDSQTGTYGISQK